MVADFRIHDLERTAEVTTAELAELRLMIENFQKQVMDDYKELNKKLTDLEDQES